VQALKGALGDLHLFTRQEAWFGGQASPLGHRTVNLSQVLVQLHLIDHGQVLNDQLRLERLDPILITPVEEKVTRENGQAWSQYPAAASGQLGVNRQKVTAALLVEAAGEGLFGTRLGMHNPPAGARISFSSWANEQVSWEKRRLRL
jgi:hypothetical protein